MREAEHTRLLASSHDATSAASSSGSVWSRVALGLGTLGVIAAVAALATSPETLMDITLGLGLSLPRETPAQHGLSTKSIRPVASGDGTRPHSALRTEDALVPKLGSHKSGHVATAGAGLVDDSDRDKQFLIPPVVVEKIAGKLAGRKSKHRWVSVTGFAWPPDASFPSAWTSGSRGNTLVLSFPVAPIPRASADIQFPQSLCPRPHSPATTASSPRRQRTPLVCCVPPCTSSPWSSPRRMRRELLRCWSG
jgi:hypothetical protein